MTTLRMYVNGQIPAAGLIAALGAVLTSGLGSLIVVGCMTAMERESRGREQENDDDAVPR